MASHERRTGKKKESRAPIRKSKTGAKLRKPIVTAEPHTVSLAVQGRPKPFVKWAGGKRQLLTAILRHVPKAYETYHEPFLGGGAVFFALSPPKSFLSDSNLRLVRCYKGIRNHVGEVISLLKEFKKTRSFFLEMRDRDVDTREDAEVAAWFIFMNKMGFNGLYRVNSKNQFNVPFGDNKRSQIFDEENLRACSRALAKAEVECEDFSAVEGRAKPGDLVYFDPPYVPLSATSSFTSYTAKGFTPKDQTALRDLALRLKQKDVRVILSNSSTARTLYQDDLFSVTTVYAARAVNSRADRRGKITELLIR
jgi:DNA adenine methylase